MIGVIDNYDSFTFNLVQYLGELGADLWVVRNDRTTPAELEAKAIRGLVVSPGPCTPNEAGISREAIRHFAGRVPILGVCLGHQCLADAFGGRVVPATNLMHGKTSEIYHDGKGVFAGLSRPFTATRYHSLIVEPESLPDCFEVSATTERGEIMGLRYRGRTDEAPLEGVQFHPESILTGEGKRLLANFVRSVQGESGGKPSAPKSACGVTQGEAV